MHETADGLTTVRHYGDSSDNPEWTTQLSGANLTTDVYTGSLGSGLAVTTTFKGTVATASMQLTNLRGHVVTTLDLDSNSVSGWSVYDSFGNPQTSQTNDNLITYSSYGQQERATNATGLILMGARVYTPETNQFTSKDPIKGGNENSYTYPNDPINGSDFTGCFALNATAMQFVKYGLDGVFIALGIFLCKRFVTKCIQIATALGGINDSIYQTIDLNLGPASKNKNKSFNISKTVIAALSSGLATLALGLVASELEPLLSTELETTIGYFLEAAFSTILTSLTTPPSPGKPTSSFRKPTKLANKHFRR